MPGDGGGGLARDVPCPGGRAEPTDGAFADTFDIVVTVNFSEFSIQFGFAVCVISVFLALTTLGHNAGSDGRCEFRHAGRDRRTAQPACGAGHADAEREAGKRSGRERDRQPERGQGPGFLFARQGNRAGQAARAGSGQEREIHRRPGGQRIREPRRAEPGAEFRRARAVHDQGDRFGRGECVRAAGRIFLREQRLDSARG